MSKPLKPNFEYLSCINNYGCGADAVYKDLSLHCVSAPLSSPQQCYVVTTDDVLNVPTVVSAPVFADKSHTLSAPSNGCVVERASHNGRDVITKINCASPESRTTTYLSAIPTKRIHAGKLEDGGPTHCTPLKVSGSYECGKLPEKGTKCFEKITKWMAEQALEGFKIGDQTCGDGKDVRVAETTGENCNVVKESHFSPLLDYLDYYQKRTNSAFIIPMTKCTDPSDPSDPVECTCEDGQTGRCVCNSLM